MVNRQVIGRISAQGNSPPRPYAIGGGDQGRRRRCSVDRASVDVPCSVSGSEVRVAGRVRRPDLETVRAVGQAAVGGGRAARRE